MNYHAQQQTFLFSLGNWSLHPLYPVQDKVNMCDNSELLLFVVSVELLIYSFTLQVE